MAKIVLNEYTIYGIIEMEIAVKINAASMEEAVRRAKEMKESDFAKPLGEYNDGNINIKGVFDEQVNMEHE
jgi:hypothetical protein